MPSGPSREEIERCFRQMCADTGRRGIIGFSLVEMVRLLPAQKQYLRNKLKTLQHAGGATAVSLGVFYHEQEVLAVPSAWRTQASPDDRWNDYARAYQSLNRLLDSLGTRLVARFGGVSEQATVEGSTGRVEHVRDYFPHCVSHRAFAEAAGLGWRGKHGLIVTPQWGPAVRFATIFIPERITQQPEEHVGCGDCRVCLDVCPILREAGDYREACRRRLSTLDVEDEVCGICVRVCWERIRARHV